MTPHDEAFARVLHSSPLPAALLDRHGAILDINDALAEASGYRAAELRGQPFEVSLDRESREPARRQFTELVSGALPHYRAERLFRRRDGRGIWAIVTLWPLHAGGESPHAYLAQLEDVTERREQEELLRLALEAGEMGTWHMDLLTGRVHVSAELERLHGLKQGRRVIGIDQYLRHVHPDDRERVRADVQRSITSGSSHDLEYRVVYPDGRQRWLRSRGRRVRLEIPGSNEFAGTCSDVTERAEAQHREQFLSQASKVLASSLGYRHTLALLADLAVPHIADWCAVDMLGESGETQRVALAHRDHGKVAAGWKIEERWPRTILDPDDGVLRTGTSVLVPLVSDEHVEHAARDEEHLAALRALGIRSGMVVPLVARDRILGAITYVTAESGRRYDNDDLALAEELAQRAALAIDNARLLDAAESASRAKDEFVARLSHEIRTPLNAMLGWTLLLRGQPDPERMNRGLDTIERNARMLARIIEDVLDFSRIVRRGLSLTLVPTNLREVAAEGIHSVEPVAEKRSIAIRLAAGEPVTTVGDAGRLQQVVWNLLTNALKFTQPGGQVDVLVDRVGDRARLVVSDTGPGIPQEILPAVFDPFRQGDTQSAVGLGLGLAIVRQIVVAHGGTVEVSNRSEPTGTVVTVLLPIAG